MLIISLKILLSMVALCFTLLVPRTDDLFLTSLLIDSFELGNFWTGLNDLKLRGNYEWTDGSLVRYTNWYNGQPDDSTRRGSCVKATLNQGYRSFITWSDDSCSSLNQFVCKKLKGKLVREKPRQVEPSTVYKVKIIKIVDVNRILNASLDMKQRHMSLAYGLYESSCYIRQGSIIAKCSFMQYLTLKYT